MTRLADLAKKVVRREGERKDAARGAVANFVAVQKSGGKTKVPPREYKAASDNADEDIERPVGSQDALDRRAFQRGGFSKAEKQAYAKAKFAEELLQSPKNPPPKWTKDKSLLPMKPPGRK